MPWGAAGAAAVLLLAWLVVPGLPSSAIAAGTNSSQFGPAEWAGNYLAGVNSVPIQRLTSTLSNVAPSTKLQLRGWN